MVLGSGSVRGGGSVPILACALDPIQGILSAVNCCDTLRSFGGPMRRVFWLMAVAVVSGCGGDEPKTVEDDSSADVDTGEVWDVPWEEGCNPLATSDDCLLPYPSLHFTQPDSSTATGLRLNYSSEQFRGPDGELDFDLGMINIADGISPVTPILVNFGIDIDEAFLSGSGDQAETVEPGAPIALIHSSTGEAIPVLTEMDRANRHLADYGDRHPLIIRPLAPMEPGERYIVLLTSALRDVNGTPLSSPPVFEALRDDLATDDPVVEGMRARIESNFSVLETAGWEREELLLSWDFQVASDTHLLGPARSMREQVMAITAEASPTYTIDEVQVDPNDSVAWLVSGTFNPPSFLDSENNLVLDGTEVVHQADDDRAYPFTMVIPAVARERGDLSLVLVGHGLFGTGSSMLIGAGAELAFHPIANELGAVLIATDWIGLSGGDLTLIISEILTDLSRIRVVTDRLVQSHANNLALVELALGDLSADPTFSTDHGEPLINPDSVMYYGISLGGIQGAGQVALSSRISRGVLAVPGAGWSHLIQRSTQFDPLELVIDSLYPDPLTQSVLVAGVQTFFDWSDPATLGRLYADPVGTDDPEKVVVLQEAIGDCQVANITTDLLARTIGARHLEVATDPVFGLDTVPAPATGMVLTQIRVPDDLDDYFPPDENTTPVTDNGVHNSAVLRTNIFEQIQVLFTTGEVIHPCEGICDPE